MINGINPLECGFFCAKKAKMTTKEARKILGIASLKLTDEQIQQDIDTAELLKNIFFDTFKSGKIPGDIANHSETCHN